MNKPNQYKWLIVVEGSTDVETFRQLFKTYCIPLNDIELFSAQGKGNVCNAENWNNISNEESQPDLLSTIKNDIGRSNFTSIILIVDSDSDSAHAFDAYKRNPDNLLYLDPVKPPIAKGNGEYWNLDTLSGVHSIPIIGISIPMNKSGCLETDLLDAYGFPVEGQVEYSSIVEVIEKASPKWHIPKSKGGGNWWDENKKAKFDKFIYSALLHGFRVCRQTPKLLTEPSVIVQIKKAITGNGR
ncbi:hypothetical protein FACS1894200_11940 [Spirochaetia bacterium]|nr:hypothetical protein FACS1894200_11940 [Spirochaetia bacterium]